MKIGDEGVKYLRWLERLRVCMQVILSKSRDLWDGMALALTKISKIFPRHDELEQ
jgi:hypothetical protein